MSLDASASVPAAPAAEAGPGVAFFDFDDTLIVGDSLLPFLINIRGRRAVQTAMLNAVRRAGWERLRRRLPAGTDMRTRIKELTLHPLLEGVTVARAHEAAEAMQHSWLRWNQPILNALLGHRDAGRRVVVATGALALYMPTLLSEVPVDTVMATEMEIDGDRLTGRMIGANCVRAEKARRVRDYVERHGPFAQSWGYGNRPSDLPMLELVTHPTIV